MDLRSFGHTRKEKDFTTIMLDRNRLTWNRAEPDIFLCIEGSRIYEHIVLTIADVPDDGVHQARDMTKRERD